MATERNGGVELHYALLNTETDRGARVARLEVSMQRWRDSELDRILPDEYDYYMRLLQYLKDGGEYKVTRFDPMCVINNGGAKSLKDANPNTVGGTIWDMGKGLASISIATIRPKKT